MQPKIHAVLWSMWNTITLSLTEIGGSGISRDTRPSRLCRHWLLSYCRLKELLRVTIICIIETMYPQQESGHHGELIYVRYLDLFRRSGRLRHNRLREGRVLPREILRLRLVGLWAWNYCNSLAYHRPGHVFPTSQRVYHPLYCCCLPHSIHLAQHDTP